MKNLTEQQKKNLEMSMYFINDCMSQQNAEKYLELIKAVEDFMYFDNLNTNKVMNSENLINYLNSEEYVTNTRLIDSKKLELIKIISNI